MAQAGTSLSVKVWYSSTSHIVMALILPDFGENTPDLFFAPFE